MIMSLIFFFFNDTATTEIYTLSLHDALPIPLHDAKARGKGKGEGGRGRRRTSDRRRARNDGYTGRGKRGADRKSTRLNSSHANISYAVFCLKKKKKNEHYQI